MALLHGLLRVEISEQEQTQAEEEDEGGNDDSGGEGGYVDSHDDDEEKKKAKEFVRLAPAIKEMKIYNFLNQFNIRSLIALIGNSSPFTLVQ
jgi:hypothetical protein